MSQLQFPTSQLQELEVGLPRIQPALTPVKRVPVEIFCEIFKTLLPDCLSDTHQSELLDMCLVCKDWRGMAHSVPQLWAVLRIKSHPSQDMSYEKIKTWLIRSKNAPRTLEIVTQSIDDCLRSPSACELGSQGLAKLLTQGPYLEHLSVSCGGPQCFRNLAACVNRQKLSHRRSVSHSIYPWDSIRSLTLTCRGDYGGWGEPHTHSESTFWNLPEGVVSLQLHLTDQSVGESDEDYDTSNKPLYIPPKVAERLTSLFIAYNMDNGTRLINALKNCVNLTTLTIDFHGSVFPADGKCNEELIIRKFLKTGVLFPKVQTLRLDGVSYRTLMNAFRLFDAPSLVNLAVEFWFPWLRGRPLIPKIASQIEYFVRTRSKCEATLRTFCLSDMAATLGELKIFLGALTTITHLTIQKMILIDNLPTGLDLFAWVKEVASSVSNLKVLHVHNLDAECGCLEGQAEFFEVGRKFHVHGGELILDGVSDGLWKS